MSEKLSPSTSAEYYGQECYEKYKNLYKKKLPELPEDVKNHMDSIIGPISFMIGMIARENGHTIEANKESLFFAQVMEHFESLVHGKIQ